ncbi:TraR/DksA family transcriptional regulator [Planosporangium thailandense]|uniref:TraR/DksA family transcriptional regulator n=2 Tax=Planosporangium thailandense TaxID=765197 RepID=A0ABX0XYB3_9ACTN|nr:TraR/DksA family transcriptional regulator [Planosporangium thailandense]
MEADATALAQPTALSAPPSPVEVVKPEPVAQTSVEVQTANVRAALEERLAELRLEYSSLIADMTTEERGLLVPDAGDDVVDIGTKAFNREQEISLANAVRERIDQVERALERLAQGGYGWCEGCAEPIPPARLAVYPSATLCVTCKQVAERR